jgi:hypothetical protein
MAGAGAVDTVVQAVAVIGLSIGAALVGQVVVRRLVRQELLSAHTTVAGIIYATLAVVYGVILGQVVIAAWGDYTDAENAVDLEVSSLVNLYRLADGWPAADREAVQQAVIAYAQAVLDSEWPAMQRGELPVSAGGYPPMLAIWEAYREITEPSVRASYEFGASIGELTDLESARSLRLVVSERPLPNLLWAALFTGAVITVAFSYLLAVENRLVQGMMLGALSGLIALLLFLVHTLEYPFRGSTGIEPSAFKVMLVQTGPPATRDGPAGPVATPGPALFVGYSVLRSDRVLQR